MKKLSTLVAFLGLGLLAFGCSEEQQLENAQDELQEERVETDEAIIDAQDDGDNGDHVGHRRSDGRTDLADHVVLQHEGHPGTDDARAASRSPAIRSRGSCDSSPEPFTGSWKTFW